MTMRKAFFTGLSALTLGTFKKSCWSYYHLYSDDFFMKGPILGGAETLKVDKSTATPYR
jgi:hypothetical protein